MTKRYKCYTCHSIITLEPGEDCPNCNEQAENLQEMCPNDNNTCTHEITFTLAYCPVCGHEMCSICGCHDVVQISRVTGYLQDVSGWNPAKKQELKDRHRENL